MVLVEGNHDTHAGAPPENLDIRMVEEPLIDGPFALCHLPVPVAGRYVLAGHLHPAYRLAGRNEAVRLPCFWFGESVGVLPAFGDFTGAKAIHPEPGDRITTIDQDMLGGAGLWLRAEPDESREQADALAAILAIGMKPAA